MRTRLRRRAAGYTLQEVMLTVAIMGIIFAIAPPMLISVKNFYLTATARSDIQRDARASLDVINRTIRQAENSTIVIDTPSGEGPYSRIRFTRVDGKYCEFRQNGTQLLMVLGNNTSVLSSNLVYIAFTFPRTDDPTLVSVSMTMGKAIELGQRKVLELTIQKVRVMNQ